MLAQASILVAKHLVVHGVPNCAILIFSSLFVYASHWNCCLFVEILLLFDDKCKNLLNFNDSAYGQLLFEFVVVCVCFISKWFLAFVYFMIL